MNKKKNKTSNVSHLVLISTLTLLSGTVFSDQLSATGLFPYCFGAKMCQMGGAGVALTKGIDSTFGNVNPALMAQVGRDIAIDPMMVFQKVEVDSSRANLTAGTPLPPYTGSIKNKDKAYAGAYLGFNYPINSKWAVGLSTAGGGGKAKYRNSIISPALNAPSKIESMAAISNQILSYRPSCIESYGVSLIAAYLQIKNNLTQFPSGVPSRGSNRTDHAWGIGARFGGQWDIGQYASMGIAASTPIAFQKLKKYRDILAHPPRVPPVVTGGFAFHVSKCTDVLFDLEGAFWGNNAFTSKQPPVGQGWRSTLSFKFGVQHKVTPDLRLRLGYNYGRTPIRKKFVFFNGLSDSVSIIENIFTTGFTYDFTPTINMDLGGSVQLNKKLTDNGRGPAGPAAQGFTLKARVFTVALGFNIKY